MAQRVVSRLREAGRPALILDGDELREVFGAVTASSQNHAREARLALAMQYSRLCRLIAGQGLTVVVATISLFKEVHEWNRSHLPGYLEVYLKVPMEELSRRDPKKIYERARLGDLKHVAGVDLEVDFPTAPHILIEHQAGSSFGETFNLLWQKLQKHITP